MGGTNRKSDRMARFDEVGLSLTGGRTENGRTEKKRFSSEGLEKEF
jgi:hypothetical protein